MNKPVSWILENNDEYINITFSYSEMREWEDFLGDNEQIIPLYTHPVINNGGNLEELNTKVQDASTSLESTPPINTEPVGRYYWESVVDGHFMAVPSEGTIHYEIDDFPLYLHPAGLTDEEIWKCVKQFTYAKYYDDFFKFAKKILRKAQEK